MTDPYKELQVSPTASDDEVKAAYRELARKYHPDNFDGNPLSDLATEKMQAINKAYDAIMQQRRSSQNGRQTAPFSGQASSQFGDIRRLIHSRRITEAEELLDGVPSDTRDAEWYFLKGTVNQYRGWLDEAFENYAAACNMDPSNNEYKNSFSQLQWQRQTARTRGGAYYSPTTVSDSCCNACAALYCINCICSCCGGGRGGC